MAHARFRCTWRFWVGECLIIGSMTESAILQGGFAYKNSRLIACVIIETSCLVHEPVSLSQQPAKSEASSFVSQRFSVSV